MALEHVAQGQTRLQTPGLAPDARGVALGRYALLIFPTLEGVVGWLRLYSAEASLDELMSGLEIARLRSPLGSRELGVRIPAVSSYACDRAARLTRLLGGATYTGSARHFVKYRDERSPYGYDAVDVGPVPAGAELVVHGDDFVQSYAREGELALSKLIFRLSLRRAPAAERLEPEVRRELLLAVPTGLGEGVVRYLWRNRVQGEVARVAPARQSAFADDRSRAYLLLRLRDAPARIVELLRGVPGVCVFRPLGATAAVALGWTHPIDLTSCASLFPADQVHLFWPGDRIDVIPGPVAFSDVAHVTRVDVAALADLGAEAAALAATHAPGEAPSIEVKLRLAPATGVARRVVATLIPRAHTTRLRRLVFALPPTVLRAYRVAQTARGLLVVGTGDVDVIPLGDLLTELAPGILVPLGFELVPRVAPDVLARALGHDRGEWTVFAGGAEPFQLQDGDLVPLERRVLAAQDVERVDLDPPAPPLPDAPEVVNDEIGRFALWGLDEPEGGKLLPPG